MKAKMRFDFLFYFFVAACGIAVGHGTGSMSLAAATAFSFAALQELVDRITLAIITNSTQQGVRGESHACADEAGAD